MALDRCKLKYTSTAMSQTGGHARPSPENDDHVIPQATIFISHGGSIGSAVLANVTDSSISSMAMATQLKCRTGTCCVLLKAFSVPGELTYITCMCSVCVCEILSRNGLHPVSHRGFKGCMHRRRCMCLSLHNLICHCNACMLPLMLYAPSQ